MSKAAIFRTVLRFVAMLVAVYVFSWAVLTVIDSSWMVLVVWPISFMIGWKASPWVFQETESAQWAARQNMLMADLEQRYADLNWDARWEPTAEDIANIEKENIK